MAPILPKSGQIEESVKLPPCPLHSFFFGEANISKGMKEEGLRRMRSRSGRGALIFEFDTVSLPSLSVPPLHRRLMEWQPFVTCPLEAFERLAASGE